MRGPVLTDPTRPPPLPQVLDGRAARGQAAVEPVADFKHADRRDRPCWVLHPASEPVVVLFSNRVCFDA